VIGALAIALVWTCGGCRRNDVRPALAQARLAEAQRNLPTVERPGIDRRIGANGPVVSEVLELPDGSVLRHGVERESYLSGAKRALRHFERDVPVGEWTQWYEDGTLRSHYVHSDRPSPMTFYAPDGQVTASGDAIRGLRSGPWRFFHSNGVLAREGSYVAGKRNGEWIQYDEQGALVGRVVFAAGERID
jgi:antitoxin component YwqK of YwqJK toxin-antitoxin module